MANKRTLKRDICNCCTELLAECRATYLYSNNNMENYDALLFSIIRLGEDFLSRISHPEPGMPAKRYFKHLKEDFVKQVNELLDQINN